MYARICGYVLSLVSVSVILAGCDDSPGGSSGAPTAPGLSQAAVVTAQPSEIAPEFISTPLCRPDPAFRTSLIVTVHAGEDRFVHALRFDFTDRRGRRVRPRIVTSLETVVRSDISVPIPLPTSSPIPIPGTLPLDGSRFPAGSRTLPVVLEFGCGVQAAGTLVVSVDTTDGRGRPGQASATVEVSQ
jgi:hypothetical protein